MWETRVNNTNDIQDVAYAVEVTAGIAIPFTLKLTVLSLLKPELQILLLKELNLTKYVMIFYRKI